MSITARILSNEIQAQLYGAKANDILIWDLDANRPYPGERIYAPHERLIAINRAIELDNQVLSDLFVGGNKHEQAQPSQGTARTVPGLPTVSDATHPGC